MTVAYLQCTNCGGLGTRTRTRARCRCCGQISDKKGEEFACNLCGHRMAQISPMTWEQKHQEVWDLEGKRYPRNA